jgi:hypothetical protein
MHLKKVIPKKHAKLGLIQEKYQFSMIFRNNFFLVHFVTKASLYFWNLRKNLRLLIPIKSTVWKKFFDPYIVNDPKCWDQWWSGHWVKTNFFRIFLTFERYTTNYRGTLVENVKKSKNQPTLLYSILFLDKRNQVLRVNPRFLRNNSF